MGDSEKNLADGKLSDDIIVEDVTVKTARTAKAKKTSNRNGFFSQVKAEFKKIIWPSRQSLGKQTLAVLLSSIGLGVIITLVDMIIRLGLELLVK